MNFIVSIQMLVVRCYFNIKCEISFSNRTKLSERLKNSTKYVLTLSYGAPGRVWLFKFARYEGTRSGALQPFKCTVHPCIDLEL